MDKFQLVSNYQPTGDQPQAIAKLVDGVNNGLRTQVLLGVTGSGKTFTMANIINQLNRPALVMAHNKTLAAQLCNEFREFFPKNRVEYFVSYYDYYMPESYIPSRDLYIEKELQINDEIDKLRHSATSSLFERRDTIVVSSVSCIYGMGKPSDYYNHCISLRPEMKIGRDKLIKNLVSVQYERNDIDFKRGSFRVRGDVVEIFPVSMSEICIRVEFFGNTIERICEIEAVSGRIISTLKHIAIFPASHYTVSSDIMASALENIERDRDIQVAEFLNAGKALEAQRIKQRTSYDIEMMREMGFCTGIENYSRYFDGRKPGETPYTLLDYFPDDFILFVDESHMTIPQVRGMFFGDKSRKTNLVEYGFRLPSAFDNRPLNFDEFNKKIPQLICVSATPAPYELQQSDQTVQQVIRPTGLLDPQIEIRKVEGQVDDLIGEMHKAIEGNGRVMVTTLTKKMAESLTTYLSGNGFKVRYLHSDIDTLDRIEIITGLRRGDFDILVGINLLREGLDMPEVKLVAILDADKEGFLRSESSLIQTIGRAARNAEGRVIMYADSITGSMQRAIDTTNNRRKIQNEYNVEHNITPKTVISSIKNTIEITKAEASGGLTIEEIPKEIDRLKSMMAVATSMLDFERAIMLRDKIGELRKHLEKSREV